MQQWSGVLNPAPIIVLRKPRDSRVVQKSLSNEGDKKTPNVLK